VSEEVELGATGDAVADHLDLLDPWAVDLERALDSDTGRNPANGDRAGDPAAAEAHDGPLEHLDALASSLDDLGRHLHGIGGRVYWGYSSKPAANDSSVVEAASIAPGSSRMTASTTTSAGSSPPVST